MSDSTIPDPARPAALKRLIDAWADIGGDSIDRALVVINDPATGDVVVATCVLDKLHTIDVVFAPDAQRLGAVMLDRLGISPMGHEPIVRSRGRDEEPVH